MYTVEDFLLVMCTVEGSLTDHVYRGRISLVMCTVEDSDRSCVPWKTFFGHMCCDGLFL